MEDLLTGKLEDWVMNKPVGDMSQNEIMEALRCLSIYEDVTKGSIEEKSRLKEIRKFIKPKRKRKPKSVQMDFMEGKVLDVSCGKTKQRG